MFLAAGTLGTNEIMLRSREHGLDTSDRLGKSFGGNGDVSLSLFFFFYPLNEEVQGSLEN